MCKDFVELGGLIDFFAGIAVTGGQARQAVVRRQHDEAARQNAPALFAVELEAPRWGQFSLETSRWLLARGWTVERKGRGETSRKGTS